MLSGVIARETKHYLYENRLDHHAPDQPNDLPKDEEQTL